MCRFRQQVVKLIFAAGLMCSLSPSIRAQSAPASAPAVIEALKAGQYPEALRLSGELVRAEPRSERAWLLRGLALEQSSEPAEALKAYQHSLTLAPNYLPALEGAAQLSYKAQSAQALPLLRRVLALQPSSSTAHAMLGVLEYRKGECGPAVEDFGATSEAFLQQPETLMAYSVCLARLNRGPEALVRFKQLLALRPSDPVVRYDLALIQWHTDASADALATLQPLLDAQTKDSRVLRLAAAIHESRSETPQAVELLRAAILANPDEPANYVDFATLSFMHGSFSVGIDIVDRGLTRIPNSAALYMARGVLYGQNGDFEKAMADFDKAHKLDPNSSMAATAEGIAHSQRHDHEAALEDFRRQVREHPKDAYAHYLLAEALSWSPPDARPGDYQKSVVEAIAAATKATELDPHLAQAYDLLGSLNLLQGNSEAAIKACRTALNLMPKDQQATYTLILALRKTGEKEEVKALVQKLIALRKEEQIENGQKARYGRLVEEP